MSQSKEEIVVGMVKAGIHTRQEIKDESGCTSASLASYLSGMRNAAKFTGVSICPIEIEDDDGKKVFRVILFADYEAAKAERAANKPSAASKKTPAERLDGAEKRLIRCESAYDKAKDRAEADEDNRELELRSDKAQIELELADIELKRAQALIDSDEAEADEAPEADEDEML